MVVDYRAEFKAIGIIKPAIIGFINEKEIDEFLTNHIHNTPDLCRLKNRQISQTQTQVGR